MNEHKSLIIDVRKLLPFVIRPEEATRFMIEAVSIHTTSTGRSCLKVVWYNKVTNQRINDWIGNTNKFTQYITNLKLSESNYEEIIIGAWIGKEAIMQVGVSLYQGTSYATIKFTEEINNAL